MILKHVLPRKGTALAEICLAINRVYSGEDGQKKEEVTFVDVVLWGRLAEIAEKYLRKGGPVFIEGKLELNTWDDKQTGKKRSRCVWLLKVCNCSEAGLPIGKAQSLSLRQGQSKQLLAHLNPRFLQGVPLERNHPNRR